MYLDGLPGPIGGLVDRGLSVDLSDIIYVVKEYHVEDSYRGNLMGLGQQSVKTFLIGNLIFLVFSPMIHKCG
ncbi:hypothetical protein CEXT_224521 [Caerostris extrusa]|uniref:Uncharacterized protein n=1 Tax=Caerostris extrusa TaxID=172846 RepID=A0AAV4M4H8_CAEEX|nr:hypothetical protein CEXT_224521 [Caerostris extrusa]